MEKSFEKLKWSLDNQTQINQTVELYNSFMDAIKITKTEKEDRYPEAFGVLESAVKKFIVVTTDLTIEQIDKNISDL